MPTTPAPTHDALWTYLLNQEEFNTKRLEKLRQDLSANKRKPLGKILIDEGYMNIKQVSALLQMQASEMTMRFGDLAVREGYCTPRQLSEAIDKQHNHNYAALETLLTHEAVDSGQLIEQLVRFIYHLEGQLNPLISASDR